MIVMSILRWVVLGATVWLALPVLYLALLSVAAIVATRRGAASLVTPAHTALPDSGAVACAPTVLPRFAVLVPAHNEEQTLPALLASLARLEYPADRYRVCVIADNCTDRTAAVARVLAPPMRAEAPPSQANNARGSGEVQVYERTHATARGKGYALAWMLTQLAAAGETFDAYVVIDADSVVDPSFLAAMAQAIDGGASALQANNTVLNVRDSASTALRWIALTLVNHVRPLGRNQLGGSSTLTGNGMCLTRGLLVRHPWRAFGLAEDYQYYLTLVAQGVRVRYVPTALVRSEMPTTFKQLRSQDIRWESQAPEQRAWQWGIARHLLVDGIGLRDRVRLDALAEFLTPPLSLLVAGCVVALGLAVVLRAPLVLALAVLLTAALLGYVGSAFVLLRPPLAVYAALLQAPRFALRKLWIYFVASRARKHTRVWVRTSRVLRGDS